MRLSFDVRMQGAQEVERTIRQMSQSLNSMPKGAERSLSDLNKSIDGIVKSLTTLSTSTSGLGSLDKTLENAFGTTKTNLIRGLGREIENLQKEVDRLTQKTEKFNEQANRARGLGNVAAASAYEGASIRSGLEAAAGQQRIAEANDALTRATGGGGGGGRYSSGGVSAHAAGAGGLIASALGIPNFLGMGPWGIAAAGLGFAYANYSTVDARNSNILRQYGTQGAYEALQGDPLRTILRQRGLGYESGFLGNPSLDRNAFFNSLRYAKNLVTTGDEQVATEKTAQELSDIDKQKYGQFQDVQQMRMAIGSGAGDTQRMFGQFFTQRAMSSILGGGVTTDLGVNAINALARFGVLGGRSDREFARSPMDYGVTQNLILAAARREGYLSRTGGRSGNSSMGDILDVFGAAGFGGNQDLGAQRITSDYVANEMSARGLLGGTSIAQVGAGFAATAEAISGATGNRLASEDVARIAGQEASSTRAGLNTAFDPRRTLALQTLMGLGFNATEAEGFVKNGLDKPSTRNAINSILARRRGVSGGPNQDFVGDALSGRYKQVFGGLEKAVGGAISADVQAAFPEIGRQILYGEEDADAAIARSAAQGAFFKGNVAGGRRRVQAPAATTEREQREEQSRVDQRLSEAVNSLASVIRQGVVGNSEGIIKSVQAVEKAILSGKELRQPRIDRPSRPITKPGNPE
jgi:hypothetical protein